MVKLYLQKFRNSWKTHSKLKPWLREDPSNRSKAYCRFCKCSLLSKYYYLLAHADTRKHLRAAEKYVEVTKNLEEYIKRPDLENAEEGTEKQGFITMESVEEIGDSSVVQDVHDESNNSKNAEREDNLYVQVDSELEEIIPDICPPKRVKSKIKSTKRSEALNDLSLQEQRLKSQRDYLRKKADYFAQLTQNSKAHKAMLVLQARKLQIEIENMQNDL